MGDVSHMNEEDAKLHFKMYKAGRKWLIAGVAAFGVGVAITQINAPEVLADTTTLTSSATVTSGEPAATNSTVTDTTESAASGTEEVPTQAAASVAPVAQAATQTSVAAQTSESA